MTADEHQQFRALLLDWFHRGKRELPWRRTRDPYAIWISEIMLQQTRVAAAIPYFERFLARFPTVEELAEAPEADLLAAWAGLGYYYRARNLQKAARLILNAGGRFPNRHAALLELPGIGHYTAAAIASIAFNLPHPVVDGNVYRVLSRIHNDHMNIASPAARPHFTNLAGALMDRSHPGDFNQALMELGATVCLPKNPQCLVCPVSALCKARQLGRQDKLPVKIINRRSVTETRTLFWIERDGHLLLWKRSAEERLMPGFWELPEPNQLPGVKAVQELGSFRHGITFHNYLFEIRAAPPPLDPGPCQWLRLENLGSVPVSTVVRKARRIVEKDRVLKSKAAAASRTG